MSVDDAIFDAAQSNQCFSLKAKKIDMSYAYRSFYKYDPFFLPLTNLMPTALNIFQFHYEMNAFTM